jgi:hypothetical protein
MPELHVERTLRHPLPPHSTAHDVTRRHHDAARCRHPCCRFSVRGAATAAFVCFHGIWRDGQFQVASCSCAHRVSSCALRPQISMFMRSNARLRPPISLP